MRSGDTLPVGRGLWFIAIAATAWGVGGLVAAVLYDTSGLGPVAVSWWRFVGGVVLLALARRWFGPRAAVRFPRRTWRSVLVTGCGLALYQTAYYVAIDLAGLAVATVVTLGAGPVLIAVGARLTGTERLDGAGRTAVAGALLGLALLVGAGTGAGTDNPAAGVTGSGAAWLAGVGFALLSAAGYAVVTLLTRRGNGIARYDTALGGFGVGALLLAPLALTAGALPAGDGLPATVALLLFLMAVPTALAYALFFAGLAVVRATTAAMVALVEPVTAAVLGVVLLNERLTPVAVSGAVIMLSTVLVLVRSERRRAAAAARS
jgi:DME family drug/metabolite transporter